MNFIVIQFVILILALVLFLMGFNVLREYERGVLFRWGRLARGLLGGHGPGVVVIIAFIDKQGGTSPGGLDLGALGPVSEGLWAWVVGMGLLIGAAVWIGAKSS